MCRVILLTLCVFCIGPATADAGLLITEVMYDLSGSDSKREWVEIYNEGNEEVDLSDWRFNDGSNHVLNPPPENGGNGSIVIPAGAYALIVSNAVTFLSEHSVSVSVIDTVMALGQQKDTNYTLKLIDAEGNVASQMTYNTAMGANGDGKSLQYISGSWQAHTPTPGRVNEASTATEESQEESASSGGGTLMFEPEKRISVSMKGTKDLIVGADAQFSAEAFGFEGELLDSAEFRWNMGDGVTKEGKTILHFYKHPGSYVVFVDAVNGKYSALSRMQVTAHPADIRLSFGGVGVDSFIEVANDMSRELNLSGWHLKVGSAFFTLPSHTVIPQGRSIRYSYAATKLVPTGLRPVELLYPNMTQAIKASDDKAPKNASKSTEARIISTSQASSLQSVQAMVSINEPPSEQKEESEEQKREEVLAASAATGGDGGDNSLVLWVGALLLLIGGASYGIYVLWAKEEKEELASLVDEFEIIEKN